MEVENDYCDCGLNCEKSNSSRRSPYYLKVEKRYPYGYTAKIMFDSRVNIINIVASVNAITYQGAIKKGRRLHNVITHEPVYVEYFEEED